MTYMIRNPLLFVETQAKEARIHQPGLNEHSGYLRKGCNECIKQLIKKALIHTCHCVRGHLREVQQSVVDVCLWVSKTGRRHTTTLTWSKV